MIGFHDHVTNGRSGRPEPHASWQAERFVTWTGWTIAAIGAVTAAAHYQKWRELDGTMLLLVGAALFSLISHLRHKALTRKRLALRQAVVVYEALLAKPFP